MDMYGELMPQGRPKFLSVIKYPKVSDIVADRGRKETLVILTLMVKDFCASLNVVRNMNEDQMVEAAAMLIDECDNFRLEDYAMMFQMAKRGELVKIMDRVDLQMITAMLDAYWQKRNTAGEEQWQKENKHLETMGTQTRMIEHLHKEDGRLLTMAEGISAAFGGLKQMVEEKVGNREERERLRQIEQADVEAIKERKKQLGYD